MCREGLVLGRGGNKCRKRHCGEGSHAAASCWCLHRCLVTLGVLPATLGVLFPETFPTYSAQHIPSASLQTHTAILLSPASRLSGEVCC